MRTLDLFSGIGGMSLGLESVGFHTVAFCEVDPFCRQVLEHHWPGVPIHDDVRTLRGADVGAVDLVAGGFPCQPVSVAGRRQGQSDARWLWPEMLRIVREVRPRWVLAENVPGLRTLGADRVLEDLESAGYACWPLVVGADDVGAPHRRKRVWIVAHARERGRVAPVGEPTGSRLEGKRAHAGEPQEPQPWHASARWPARPGEPQHPWEEPRLLAHAERAPGRAGDVRRGQQQPEVAGAEGDAHPWNAQRPMGGPVDGLPERLVRRANREALRALGNAVVPDVVAQIGRAILAAEAESVA